MRLPLRGLQNVEATLLYRELDVLHVAVVFFKQRLGAIELVVDLRQALFQGLYGFWCANARHHIFAGGIEQYFAEELALAG